MEVSFDNIFVIGDGHKVCEDYAWSGLIGNRYPCVMISDGCSSSPNTDLGSRILVRSLIFALTITDLTQDDTSFMEQTVEYHFGTRVNEIRKALGIPVATLDATIVMSILVDDRLYIFSYGDGYTVIRNHTTGEIRKDFVKYPFNAPYYFNYKLNHTKHIYLKTYKGQMVNDNGTDIPVEDHAEECRWGYFDIEDLDTGVWSVSVMSDGVETFFKGNDNFDTDEVLEDITAFKNFKGEYVQRKVGMYLSRHAKKNVQHYDDISLASMMFEVNSNNI